MRYHGCAVGSILIWLTGCAAGSVPQAGMPQNRTRAAISNTLLIAGTAARGTRLCTFTESHPPRFVSFKRFPTLHAVAMNGSSFYLGEANRIEVRNISSGRLTTILSDASSAPHFTIDAIAISGDKMFAAANITQCANGAQACGGSIAVYHVGDVHREARIHWPKLGRVPSIAVDVSGTRIVAGWTDTHLGEHVSHLVSGNPMDLNPAGNGPQPPSVAFVGDVLAIGAGSSGAFGTGNVRIYSFVSGTVVQRFGHLNGALVVAPDAENRRLFAGAYGFFRFPGSAAAAGTPPGIAVFGFPSGVRTGKFGNFTAVYAIAFAHVK